MGIVFSTASMHHSHSYPKMRPIQLQIIKKVFNLIESKGVPVTIYIQPEESELSKLVFKTSKELFPSFRESKNFTLNFLRHPTIFLERPGWSGYTSNVCEGKYPRNFTMSLLRLLILTCQICLVYIQQLTLKKTQQNV